MKRTHTHSFRHTHALQLRRPQMMQNNTETWMISTSHLGAAKDDSVSCAATVQLSSRYLRPMEDRSRIWSVTVVSEHLLCWLLVLWRKVWWNCDEKSISLEFGWIPTSLTLRWNIWCRARQRAGFRGLYSWIPFQRGIWPHRPLFAFLGCEVENTAGHDVPLKVDRHKFGVRGESPSPFLHPHRRPTPPRPAHYSWHPSDFGRSVPSHLRSAGRFSG